MPVNLTETSSWDTPTGPIGTDIRNAADVRSHLQPLANRERYLYDRTTPLLNITALKAVVAEDKLVRLVDKFGLYVFDASSGAPESLPWVVAPSSGSGRWLHSSQGTVGVPHGTAKLGSNGQLEIEGAGFPTFKTPRSYSEVIHPLPFSLTPGWEFAGGSVLPGVVSGPGADPLGDPNIYFPIGPHNGATLASVDCYIVPDTGHTGVPDSLPRLNVLRYPEMVPGMDFVNHDSLRAAGAQAFSPPPATGAEWANGKLKRWTYTCDQLHVIDRSKYKYLIRLTDEGGPMSRPGNLYFGFRLNYTNVVDMRFP